MPDNSPEIEPGLESLALLAALASLAESDDSPQELPEDRGPESEYAFLLRRRYETLLESYDFNEGDLVEWKPGLKNRNRPLYGEVGVILSLLEDATIDRTQDSGSQYYLEPLDMVVGILDGDRELLHMYLDRRRFMPAEG